jgi:putative intracellular protease/amidase
MNPQAMDFVRAFFQQQKPVAAICHTAAGTPAGPPAPSPIPRALLRTGRELAPVLHRRELRLS